MLYEPVFVVLERYSEQKPPYAVENACTAILCYIEGISVGVFDPFAEVGDIGLGWQNIKENNFISATSFHKESSTAQLAIRLY